MATSLIAVLFVIMFAHWMPELARLRDHRWLDAWLSWLGERIGAQPLYASAFGLLAVLVPPLLVLGLIQGLLSDWLFGLPAFGFAVAALFWFWGPRSLDHDVQALALAETTEARSQTARELGVAVLPDDYPGQARVLVDAVFAQSLARWFGVLFWFVVFGVVGAALYRLAWLLATRLDLRAKLPEESRISASRLLDVLDWPATQAIALALAVVSHFDAVIDAWRGFLAERRGRLIDMQPGLLQAVGQACVRIDEREEEEEGLVDGSASVRVVHEPVLALGLAWRVMWAWLTVLALLVIGGWVQ